MSRIKNSLPIEGVIGKYIACFNVAVEKGEYTESDNKWHVTEIKEQNLGLRNKTGRILRKSPEKNFTVSQPLGQCTAQYRLLREGHDYEIHWIKIPLQKWPFGIV